MNIIIYQFDEHFQQHLLHRVIFCHSCDRSHRVQCLSSSCYDRSHRVQYLSSSCYDRSHRVQYLSSSCYDRSHRVQYLSSSCYDRLMFCRGSIPRNVPLQLPQKNYNYDGDWWITLMTWADSCRTHMVHFDLT